jgi:hypothetical protein
MAPLPFSPGIGVDRIIPSNCLSHPLLVHERPGTLMKKRKGRRKVGRKKRRMRAKIRHRK